MGDDHLEHLGVCGRISFRDSFGQDRGEIRSLGTLRRLWKDIIS